MALVDPRALVHPFRQFPHAVSLHFGRTTACGAPRCASCPCRQSRSLVTGIAQRRASGSWGSVSRLAGKWSMPVANAWLEGDRSGCTNQT